MYDGRDEAQNYEHDVYHYVGGAAARFYAYWER